MGTNSPTVLASQFSPLRGTSEMKPQVLSFKAIVLLFTAIILLGIVLLSPSNGGARWTRNSSSHGGLVPISISGEDSLEDTPYSKWHRDALSKLTVFRDSLFPAVLQHNSWNRPFLAREDWALFKPAVTCPPGRPLTRYPDVPGDGPKLLCQLDETALPGDDCLIYSLGSHGEVAARQLQQCDDDVASRFQHC
jgi:hypothetical protein